MGGFEIRQSDVLVVGIGGGDGHDLVRFFNTGPLRHGRIFLQDLLTVVSNLRIGPRTIFDLMAYDFYTKQPVRHARAHYLYKILSDLSGGQCIQILRNQRPALKAGYSRIVINEVMMPDNQMATLPLPRRINCYSLWGRSVYVPRETDESLSTDQGLRYWVFGPYKGHRSLDRGGIGFG